MAAFPVPVMDDWLMLSLPMSISHCCRRGAFGFASSILGILSLSTFRPTPAQAVKGAAELDAEAYLRDLIRGNPLTGLDQVLIDP